MIAEETEMEVLSLDAFVFMYGLLRLQISITKCIDFRLKIRAKKRSLWLKDPAHWYCERPTFTSHEMFAIFEGGGGRQICILRLIPLLISSMIKQ